MKNLLYCTLCFILFIGFSGFSQHEKLVLNFEKSKKVSPIIYGWHYEEIGMIGEGGLYAKMVRNRVMEEVNPPEGLEIKDGKYVNVPNPDFPAKNESVNNKNVIAAMDLSPTFLSIAGVKNYHIKFDGIDISNIMIGKNQPPRKQPIMWLRPTDHDIKKGVDYPDLAIRKGDYKLLVNFDGSGVELFNIRKDEAETTNLEEKYPEIVNELQQKLSDWRKEVAAQIPEGQIAE